VAKVQAGRAKVDAGAALLAHGLPPRESVRADDEKVRKTVVLTVEESLRCAPGGERDCNPVPDVSGIPGEV